jgi:RimJ/RimL family protein N-acetyltransferase
VDDPAATGRIDMPTLRGSVVELRPLDESDGDALLEIFGDSEVVRFMSIPLLRTNADARAFVAGIAEGRRARTLFQWGVVEPGQSTVIGTCTLAAINWRNERAELGFALGRRRWGSGFMRAALPLVIDHAFRGLGLHRIEADADPRNVRSLRLLENLGFQPEGRQRDRYLAGGERQDAVLYGLLANEWRPGD